MAVTMKRERIKTRSIMLPTIGRSNGGQEDSKRGPGEDIGRKPRTCTVSWKPRAASEPDALGTWP